MDISTTVFLEKAMRLPPLKTHNKPGFARAGLSKAEREGPISPSLQDRHIMVPMEKTCLARSSLNIQSCEVLTSTVPTFFDNITACGIMYPSLWGTIDAAMQNRK